MYNTSLFFTLIICISAAKIDCNETLFLLLESNAAKHREYNFSFQRRILSHRRTSQTSCSKSSHLQQNIFDIHPHPDTVCIVTNHMLFYVLATPLLFITHRQVYSWNFCKQQDLVPPLSLSVVFYNEICYKGQTQQSSVAPKRLALFLTNQEPNR